MFDVLYSPIMNKFVSWCSVIVCSLLFGCASVKSASSSGQVAPSKQIHSVTVVYNPTLPNQYSVHKQARGYKPVITDADRVVVSNNTRSISRVVSEGLKNRFPAMAAQYGLQVVGASDGIPKLVVSIVSSRLACSSMGCQTLVWFKGDLSVGSEENFWNFRSEFGQPIVNAEISNDLFDAFAKSLLDSMKKDSVIAM